MSRPLKILAASFAGLLVIVLGLAWWLGLFSSEPEAASVDAAAESVAASDDGTSEAISDISGTWTVEQGDATFVGYRVKEVLSTIGDFEAVGRTPGVTGTLVADGTTISSVSVTADLTGLASDNGARDGQLRTQALETDTFPEGTFELTAPIDIGAVPAEGETVVFGATGELTLHGVTNTVTLDVNGTVQSGKLIVVGSTPIVMSDYGIDPPQAPIVASIEDEGVMEVSLVFGRG